MSECPRSMGRSLPNDNGFDASCLEHFLVWRGQARVGDEHVDLRQWAHDVTGRAGELRAVDEHDDLSGAIDQATLGGHQYDVRLHEARWTDRSSSHEQLRRVETRHAIVAAGRKDDVLL